MRFNGEVVDRVRRTPGITLGELIDAMGLSDWFRRYYLLPMAGAIWSARPEQMLAFPAQVFVTFFENHSLLSLSGQPQWLTIDGGSERYVEALSEPFRHRVRLGCAATRVVRGSSGVRVADAGGGELDYDHVVFACHSDEALALLGEDADDGERDTLGAIKYQPNVAVLHRDPRFMPKRQRCWASWNYHSDGRGDEAAISLTYWMNSLQGIDPAYPLFVTLNPPQPIDCALTFDTHLFHHPVFDTAAMAAQKRIAAAQGRRNTWFCGAYMRHGFHEDGLVSAMAVAGALGAPAPWLSAPPSPLLVRPPTEPVPA
jgi:predicted NAD/FAD-binding protein